jgi:hypothetical protein
MYKYVYFNFITYYFSPKREVGQIRTYGPSEEKLHDIMIKNYF